MFSQILPDGEYFFDCSLNFLFSVNVKYAYVKLGMHVEAKKQPILRLHLK